MLESLSHLDISLFMAINGCHHQALDVLFHLITQLGSGWVAVPLTGAIIAVVTPRKYLVTALLCAAIAGTVTGIANTQIKRLCDRPRPLLYFNHADAPSIDVHVVGASLTRRSFPSGHTVTAFAAATLLAVLFRGLFVLAFIPAFLVAFSRIYVGAHFPFDTLGGALLGSGITFGLVALFLSRSWLPRPLPIRRAHAQQ